MLPFIAAPCRSTRECIYDASNQNHGFPPIVGPWADNWGHSRHMSPRRYQKRAHGRIFGDFFREPAQGRIFEWALLRGLPVTRHTTDTERSYRSVTSHWSLGVVTIVSEFTL